MLMRFLCFFFKVLLSKTFINNKLSKNTILILGNRPCKVIKGLITSVKKKKALEAIKNGKETLYWHNIIDTWKYFGIYNFNTIKWPFVCCDWDTCTLPPPSWAYVGLNVLFRFPVSRLFYVDASDVIKQFVVTNCSKEWPGSIVTETLKNGIL